MISRRYRYISLVYVASDVLATLLAFFIAWQVRFANDPVAGPRDKVRDMVTRQMVHARGRHAVHKRQLAKTELAEHGLSNDWTD